MDLGSPSRRHKRKRRLHSRQRQSSTKTGPPTAEDPQEDEQRVVAAVASMGGSSLSNMSPTREMSKEQTESDSKSTASAHSSMLLPVVTLGTADELM
ncbi:hypothetical protein NDU88_002515 [Pleurodeles waltl]|uniref:Uncharacterized protein n=1 Tax=Pleurodeles waltl TaxID=8319 RepID=A0AAV7SAQ6_PLEWA|nr:hypothetical protein NDU88_002515 [Pleurodeles waltl]